MSKAECLNLLLTYSSNGVFSTSLPLQLFRCKSSELSGYTFSEKQSTAWSNLSDLLAVVEMYIFLLLWGLSGTSFTSRRCQHKRLFLNEHGYTRFRFPSLISHEDNCKTSPASFQLLSCLYSCISRVVLLLITAKDMNLRTSLKSLVRLLVEANILKVVSQVSSVVFHYILFADFRSCIWHLAFVNQTLGGVVHSYVIRHIYCSYAARPNL